MSPSSRVKTVIAGIDLPNPFILASGILDMTGELLIRIAKDGAGAVTTKSIGPHPQKGHVGPNIAIVPSGILNAMGLPNPGCDAFVKEIQTYKRAKLKAPLIASTFGRTEQEFAHVSTTLENAGADAIEINVSCPHSDECLMSFGLDPVKTGSITKAVVQQTSIPVFVKLPGNTNIPTFTKVAQAAINNGAAGLVATNTLPAIAIEPETGIPILGNIVGGLSGPGIQPVGVRLIYELSQLTNKTIVGVGGIQQLHDALNYFSVGASAVQIGTGIFSYDTDIFQKLTIELDQYLKDRKLDSLNHIIGRTHRWLKTNKKKKK